MSIDEQFRPAIDNLTARLRRDVDRHLDAAVEELTAQAEKLAAATEAERATALQQAAQTAWAEAERLANERFAKEKADAEQDTLARLATERDQMEQSALTRVAAERDRIEQAALARLAAERNEMERLTLERLDAERADVERATIARLLAERADAERATVDRLSAERADAERTLVEQHSAEKADAERLAGERLAAETEAVETRTVMRLRADDIAAGERLVRGIRNIDAGQSLSEILETLAAAAVAEAPRVALFLAGGGQFQSWRFHGFEPAFSTADELTLTNDDAGIVAETARRREPLSGGGHAEWQAPPFAMLPVHRLSTAVPLIVNDEVVVVLYADEGPTGDVERASWPATVEVLARHASRALEALTAHRLARSLSDRTGARPRPAPRPVSVAGPSPASAAARGSATATLPAPLLVEDEHVAAQRFARQLVSDIRAANESDVFAGLRERNLMVRLGGEIARAWGQYEARVPESIRANTNYFHAEMVKTLANGDASLLSPNP